MDFRKQSVIKNAGLSKNWTLKSKNLSEQSASKKSTLTRVIQLLLFLFTLTNGRAFAICLVDTSGNSTSTCSTGLVPGANNSSTFRVGSNNSGAIQIPAMTMPNVLGTVFGNSHQSIGELPPYKESTINGANFHQWMAQPHLQAYYNTSTVDNENRYHNAINPVQYFLTPQGVVGYRSRIIY